MSDCSPPKVWRTLQFGSGTVRSPKDWRIVSRVSGAPASHVHERHELSTGCNDAATGRNDAAEG